MDTFCLASDSELLEDLGILVLYIYTFGNHWVENFLGFGILYSAQAIKSYIKNSFLSDH